MSGFTGPLQGNCLLELPVANAQAAVAEAPLQGLRNQLATVQSDVVQVNAEIGTVESEINTANGRSASIQAQYESANAQLGPVLINLTNADRDQLELEQEILQMQDRTSVNENARANIESEIADLDAEVADLLAEINAQGGSAS